MARIRSIKPEFFTSDDICALSPLARLLYIGLWCEADREGRMVWLPRVFKRRYLPDDECDIEMLCKELLGRDLVRLYGDDLAFIPTFSEHQRVNPREAASTLATPDCHAANLDLHASIPDVHTQVGREGKEGKGKEGNGSRVVTRACELPDDWQPDDEDRTWAAKARPDLTPALLDAETEKFRNHASANGRTAMNWGPNWRNWIMRADAAKPAFKSREEVAAVVVDRDDTVQWQARLRGYGPEKFWNRGDWGPRPGEPGCRVPKPLLAELV